MGRETAGQWIRKLRVQAGYLTQSNLARALGYKSHGAISAWENDQGHPDAAIVPKLSSLLGVPQAEIIDRFGIKMPGPVGLDLPAPAWARELLQQARGDGAVLDAIRDLRDTLQGVRDALADQTAALKEVRSTIDRLDSTQAGQTRELERLGREMPKEIVRLVGRPSKPAAGSRRPHARTDPGVPAANGQATDPPKTE